MPNFPSDIEIAQNATMSHIKEIAKKINIEEDDLEYYGKYKAKLPLHLQKEYPKGKLILVSAMSPTKYGEGKTTMSIGLTDGLNFIGKKAIAVLREPSLGPVFGLKGGAAGGGYAQVLPMEDINLHFAGDFSAIEKANNTPFGLSAGVWTDKGSRILWTAKHLRAGVIWANTFNKFDPASPFGGYKESGWGREGGRHGLAAYLKGAK